MDEIIKALHKEKEILQKKLEAIESALIGFGASTELKSSITLKRPEKNSTSYKPKSDTRKNYNRIYISEKYDPSAPWREKIAFVLKDMKNGAVADEIADEIIKIDSNQKGNDDYVNNTVTQYASRMYRNGEINAVRVGRKFRYSLKKIK